MKYTKNIILILSLSIPLFAIGSDIDVKIPKSKCSNVDIKTKMGPELQKHFSEPRNQDSVGWCYGFTAADLISAEIGRPLSSTHVSAIFNKNVDNSMFMKLGYNISRLYTNNVFETTYEGGFIDSAIKYAVREGRLCLESDLPYDRNYVGEIKDAVTGLEMIKEIISDGKDEAIVCSVIEYMKDEFSLNVDTKELFAILEKENLNRGFAKLIKSHCKESLVSIPKLKVKQTNRPSVNLTGKPSTDTGRLKHLKKRASKYLNLVGETLEKGKPLGVAYNMKHVTRSEGLHASVVTARRWHNGTCMFKVRNSWGKGCSGYDSRKIKGCDYDEGAFWVSDQTFYDMADSITHIRD